MKRFYIHILIKNKVLFSTLPEELREEAEKSEYIYKNCICPIKRIMKRQNKEAVQDVKRPQKVGQVKHYPVIERVRYCTGLFPFNRDLILLLL